MFLKASIDHTVDETSFLYPLLIYGRLHVYAYCRTTMDAIFRHNDPTKGVMETIEVEGMVTFPLAIDMFLNGRTFQQQIDGVKSLPLNDNDVVVCAYAKCGKSINLYWFSSTPHVFILFFILTNTTK